MKKKPIIISALLAGILVGLTSYISNYFSALKPIIRNVSLLGFFLCLAILLAIGWWGRRKK